MKFRLRMRPSTCKVENLSEWTLHEKCLESGFASGIYVYICFDCISSMYCSAVQRCRRFPLKKSWTSSRLTRSRSIGLYLEVLPLRCPISGIKLKKYVSGFIDLINREWRLVRGRLQTAAVTCMPRCDHAMDDYVIRQRVTCARYSE
jgi:hypothetical protein